jgi:hypothetical protein
MWNLKYVILSSVWMDGGTVLCSYLDVGFGALCRVGRVMSICIGVCHPSTTTWTSLLTMFKYLGYINFRQHFSASR